MRDMSEKLRNTMLALAVIVSLGILVWGFDKGFNLSDGGCYVLRYQDIQPSTPSDYNYFDHFLIKAILPPFLRTIISLRYIGFLINLLSSAFFGCSIFYVYRKAHGKAINVFLLAFMMSAGLVLSYTGLPAELSYNSLNQFFMINCGALLLFTISVPGSRSRILAFLSGVAGCMVFFSKGSSAVVIGIIACIILLLDNPRDWKRLVSFCLPYILALAGLAIIVRPDFIGIAKYLMEFPADHSVSNLAQSILNISVTVTTNLISAYLISFFFRKFRTPGVNKTKAMINLICGVLLLTVLYTLKFIEHIDDGFVSSSIFVLTIGILFFNRVRPQGNTFPKLSGINEYLHRHKYLLLCGLILFLIPYIGAFGSWVTMNWVAKSYYVSFLGLIALLMPYNQSRIVTNLVYSFLIYLVLAGSYLYVFRPYHWEPSHKPLYEQTVLYKGIKLTPDRVEYLKKVEAVLKANGFQSEQGMIIPYVAPGIAYLMGTYSVGGILWRPEIQKEYFNLVKRTKVRFKPVIISVYIDPDMQFRRLLRESTGIDFPGDYRKVAEFTCFDNITTTRIYMPYKIEMP